jgi:hypothetical protein
VDESLAKASVVVTFTCPSHNPSILTHITKEYGITGYGTPPLTIGQSPISHFADWEMTQDIHSLPVVLQNRSHRPVVCMILVLNHGGWV